MTLVLYALLIIMMVSNGVVFGMEKEGLQKELKDKTPKFSDIYKEEQHQELKPIIKTSDSRFEKMAPKIRELAQKDKVWEEIVSRSCYTESLFRVINNNLTNYGLYKNGFDLSIRDEGKYIYVELAAALLGTKGAIEFGKECIQQDSAKTRLKKFIFDIVEYGDSSSVKGLSWEDEDRDVVRAALDMGFEPDMLSDSECWIAAGIPLLITAVGANKIKVVELLIERKVNVNKTDTYGRTPLIMAAMNGNLECVKKLLTAGAVTWLCDGYDKYAIDYAKKYLSEASEADEKKEYEAIIDLLESANKK